MKMESDGTPVDCCEQGSQLLREHANDQQAYPGHRHVRLNVQTPGGFLNGCVWVFFCPWCGCEFKERQMSAGEIRKLGPAERARCWRDLAKDLCDWAAQCPPGDKDKGLRLSREDQEKFAAILDGMVDEMQRFNELERYMVNAAMSQPRLIAMRDDPEDADSQRLVCSMCDQESEELHTWKRCAEELKARRDALAEYIDSGACDGELIGELKAALRFKKESP